MRRADLIGEKFGRLTVVELLESDDRGHARWRCECECGGQTICKTDVLRRGQSKSCGCLQRESVTKKNTTHGKAGTALHVRWKGLLGRCNNHNHAAYPDYGGRGITICERWLNFENFAADMGEPPTPVHTIERIDNDKGYSPSNCRWATRSEQSRNKRNNRLLKHNGKTQCLTDWSKETGIPVICILDRIDKLGWSVDEALTTPARPKRKT